MTNIHLVGIGGTGVQIVSELAQEKGERGFKTLAIDIDDNSLVTAKEMGVDKTIHIAYQLGYRDAILEEVEWVKGNDLPSEIPDAGIGKNRRAAKAIYEYHRERNIVKDAIEDFVFDISRDTDSKDVFLITSLGGGTGSGVFLDFARDLKAEMVRKSVSKNIIGIGIMPSYYMDEDRRCAANGYAALKELDYLLKSEENPFFAFILMSIYQPGRIKKNLKLAQDEVTSALKIFIKDFMGIATKKTDAETKLEISDVETIIKPKDKDKQFSTLDIAYWHFPIGEVKEHIKIREELEAVNKELIEINNKLSAKNEEIENLKSQKKDLLPAVIEEMADIGELKESKEKMIKEQESLKTKIREIDDEIAKLREAIKTKKEEKSTKVTDRENKQIDIDTLESEITAITNELTEKENKYKRFNFLTRQGAKAKKLSGEINTLKGDLERKKEERNQKYIELQKIKTGIKSLDNEIKLKQDEIEQKEKDKEKITNSLTKYEDDIKEIEEKIDEKKEEAKKKIERANSEIEEQIKELNAEISSLVTEKDNKESEKRRKEEYLWELAKKIGGTARESQLVYPYSIEIDGDIYTKIREEVKEKGDITSNIEELLGPRELKGVIREIVESSCSSNYLELERGKLRPQFKKPGIFVGINDNEVFKKFENDIKKIATEKLLTLLPKGNKIEDSYPITIPEKFDIHIYTILDNLSLDSIAEVKELHEKFVYLTEALGTDFRANFIDAWESGEIS